MQIILDPPLFCTTYNTGLPTAEKLADIVNDLLYNPLLETNVDELLTKHPRPENSQSPSPGKLIKWYGIRSSQIHEISEAIHLGNLCYY